MKKMIFLAALAAGVMTSCTNSETIDISEGRAISFKNAAITRATSPVTGGEFNIVAYKGLTATPTQFPTGGAWTFDDVYNLSTHYYASSANKLYYYDGLSSYWFYCYAGTNATATSTDGTTGVIGSKNGLKPVTAFTSAPGGATFKTAADNIGTDGVPSLSFTTNDNASVDLVTAKAALGKDDQPAAGNKYGLTFYHALSRVRFTAYTDTYDETSKIVITGLTFTVNTNNGTISDTQFGTSNMTPGSAAKTTYTLANTFQDYLTATTPAAIANKDDQVFYVIPQTLSGTDACIKVNYTVNGVAAEEKVFPLDAMVLASGNSYNFQIKISLKAIQFTAVLEDWTEGVAIDKTIP